MNWVGRCGGRERVGGERVGLFGAPSDPTPLQCTTNVQMGTQACSLPCAAGRASGWGVPASDTQPPPPPSQQQQQPEAQAPGGEQQAVAPSLGGQQAQIPGGQQQQQEPGDLSARAGLDGELLATVLHLLALAPTGAEGDEGAPTDAEGEEQTPTGVSGGGTAAPGPGTPPPPDAGCSWCRRHLPTLAAWVLEALPAEEEEGPNEGAEGWGWGDASQQQQERQQQGGAHASKVAPATARPAGAALLVLTGRPPRAGASSPCASVAPSPAAPTPTLTAALAGLLTVAGAVPG